MKRRTIYKPTRSRRRRNIRRLSIAVILAGAAAYGGFVVLDKDPAPVADAASIFKTAEVTSGTLSTSEKLDGSVELSNSMVVLHRIEGQTSSANTNPASSTASSPTSASAAAGALGRATSSVVAAAVTESITNIDGRVAVVPDCGTSDTTPVTAVPTTEPATVDTMPATTPASTDATARPTISTASSSADPPAGAAADAAADSLTGVPPGTEPVTETTVTDQTTAPATATAPTTAPTTGTTTTTVVPGPTATTSVAATPTAPDCPTVDDATTTTTTPPGGPGGGGFGGFGGSSTGGGPTTGGGNSSAAAATARITQTVTSVIAIGSTASLGDVLYTVDSEPVVALSGALPAWRTLSTDSDDGSDIQQLESSLVSLGYDRDGTVVVDNEFDSDTEAMIERWQQGLGMEATGEVALGSVVFLPTTTTVSDVTASVGDEVGDGDTIVTLAAATQEIVVDVPDGAEAFIVPGLEVGIGSGGNSTGVVSLLRSTERDGAVVVQAVITPAAPIEGASNGSAVSVTVTVDNVANVLIVPADALLSRLDGTYSVQVRATDGTVSWHTVEVLGISANKVGIRGAGDDAESLVAGSLVLVPV